MELQAYTPAGLAIVCAVGFCVLLLALAMFVGPKRLTPTKLGPFECGSEPIGSPRARYSVKFYQVAILFLVFDLEVVFIYPWAVKYSDFLDDPSFGAVALGGMLIFIGVGVFGYKYRLQKYPLRTLAVDFTGLRFEVMLFEASKLEASAEFGGITVAIGLPHEALIDSREFQAVIVKTLL